MQAQSHVLSLSRLVNKSPKDQSLFLESDGTNFIATLKGPKQKQ